MRKYLFCAVLLLGIGSNTFAVEVPSSLIDDLEIARVLTQEERDILKRYPVICEAIAVVNQMPRYVRNGDGTSRCHPLKLITHALLEIGDKEAAKVALRLTHKTFVDMPFMMQPDSFFARLPAENFYSQVCMKPGDSLSGVRYIVLEVFFHNFTLTPGAPECLIYPFSS
ncbi:MAG: hypothetical protein FWE95_02935, partial [Planctomycetaceae bacterium]|nr:hypothetical protein [Planctomycetaceae bacterium]